MNSGIVVPREKIEMTLVPTIPPVSNSLVSDTVIHARRHRVKTSCSTSAKMTTAAYQIFSCIGGGVLCWFAHPEFAVPIWSAQGCCGIGWIFGNCDRQREFKKQLDQLGDFISLLTEEQITLADHAEGLKTTLKTVHTFVVDDGFSQVLQLNRVLKESIDDGSSSFDYLSKSIDEIVAGQADILQSMGQLVRSSVGLTGISEAVASRAEDFESKVQEIGTRREEGELLFSRNLQNMQKLQELRGEGNGLLQVVQVVLKDLVSVNQTIALDREKMKQAITELSNISMGTDERAASVRYLTSQIKEQTEILYAHLAEAKLLVEKNKKIVNRIYSLAERLGGMDELMRRIEYAVDGRRE